MNRVDVVDLVVDLVDVDLDVDLVDVDLVDVYLDVDLVDVDLEVDLVDVDLLDVVSLSFGCIFIFWPLGPRLYFCLLAAGSIFAFWPEAKLLYTSQRQQGQPQGQRQQGQRQGLRPCHLFCGFLCSGCE